MIWSKYLNKVEGWSTGLLLELVKTDDQGGCPSTEMKWLQMILLITSALFPIEAAHNGAACNKQAYWKKEMIVVIVTLKSGQIGTRCPQDEGRYRRAARDQQAVNRPASHSHISFSTWSSNRPYELHNIRETSKERMSWHSNCTSGCVTVSIVPYKW